MQLAGKFVGCLNSDKMQNVIAGVTGNVPTNTEVGAAWAKDHQDVASFVTRCADRPGPHRRARPGLAQGRHEDTTPPCSSR